jgi:hypothetical protein
MPLIIRRYSSIIDVLVKRVNINTIENQINVKASDERSIKYWSVRTKRICEAIGRK